MSFSDEETSAIEKKHYTAGKVLKEFPEKRVKKVNSVLFIAVLHFSGGSPNLITPLLFQPFISGVVISQHALRSNATRQFIYLYLFMIK